MCICCLTGRIIYYVFIVIVLDSLMSGGKMLQVTELPFFATKVRLGRGGAEEIFPIGPLNEYERFASLVLMLFVYDLSY